METLNVNIITCKDTVLKLIRIKILGMLKVFKTLGRLGTNG